MSGRSSTAWTPPRALHGGGRIDLNGALGLDRHVRNGYKLITVRLAVEGDAPAEQLRELVEQARARSVLIDILAATVPVVIETETV